MADDWLTIKEVAVLYGVTPDGVYKRLKRKQPMPTPYKLGLRTTRWSRREVMEDIANRKM